MSAFGSFVRRLGFLRQWWERLIKFDERQRFYAVLAIFNAMLVLILLLGSHTQVLIKEVKVIETRVIWVKETVIVFRPAATALSETATAVAPATTTSTPVTPTPTSTTTWTPSVTPVVSGTPLGPSLMLIGIMPRQMTRAETGEPVLIVITGANFATDVSASLGSIPVTIQGRIANTITGTLPISLPVGVYDLTVTHPGRQATTLFQAFAVKAP